MPRCGTCGQPRDAWKTVEAAVAAMLQRDPKKKRRPPTGALKFMTRLASQGGRIVSTASLTVEQIIEARESQRLFITGEGLGFVIFPACGSAGNAGVPVAHGDTVAPQGTDGGHA
jgi:hypothetical protein